MLSEPKPVPVPVPSATWRPLLVGRSAERALAAVDDVVADLTSPDFHWEAVVDRELVRPSLANGDAGLALLWAYLHRYRPAAGFDRLADAALDRAVDQVGRALALPDLYSGFAGVAWVLEHLRGWLLADDGDDSNAEIDEALLGYLRITPWRSAYDLTSGLVGFAVYALERLPRPSAVAMLEAVVERLAETAEQRPDGFCWHTPPEMMPEESREIFPGGNENLGVAHGVPGIVAVLAQTVAAGVAVERARPLLDGAVAWLTHQKLDDGCESLFPYAVGDGVAPKFTRAAWCYGDPGIAASLLPAARAAGRPDWEAEALAVARAAAVRPEETAGVRDGCLCHGSGGLGHMFNRLYQATGDEAFGAAATAWYERLLDERRPGEGIGGFLCWGPGADGDMHWSADPTFLNGAAGIALALLAATGSVSPDWDRVLLLSPAVGSRAGW
jgi:lantibiotic modifying enzyme